MRRFNASGIIGSIELAGPGEVSEIIFDDGSKAYIEEPELRQLKTAFGSLEGSLGKSILYVTSRVSKIICGLQPTDMYAFDRLLKSLER